MNKSLLTMAFAAFASAASWAQLVPAEMQYATFPEGTCVLNTSKAPQTFAATRADESTAALNFSYAYDPYSALILTDKNGNALPTGTTVYEAFEFTRDLSVKYADKTVTSVNIWTGTTVNPSSGANLNKNMTRKVTVFLAEDLDKEPFYVQEASLSANAFDLNTVKLTTPYTIEEGKSFVVGYYFKPLSQGSYYLTVDGIPSSSAAGGYCGYKLATSDNIEWGNCAASRGNLCIGCTIEGEGLPMNGVRMFSITVPEYVQPGVGEQYAVFFAGDAANEASSVELEYTIGTSAPKTQRITMQTPLGYNQLVGYNISNIVCNDEGIAVPVEFKITKVNDLPNSSDNSSMTSALMCFNKNQGFTKKHTFEEGTGTWCGWCPAGIVMLDYIKEKYSDTAVVAAIHGGDEMQVISTNPVLGKISGFPTILVNRTSSISPALQGASTSTALIESYIDNIMNSLNTIPAPAEISSIEAKANSNNSVTLTVGTTFAFDTPNADRFRLSYYVTEDGVGPYSQTNYFEGSSADLSGWNKEGESVETIYDDVVRLLEGGATGLTNSLPTSIEAMKEYESTVTLSTVAVKGSEFKVIAMINDNLSGSILNAAEIRVTKDLNDVSETLAEGNAAAAKGGKGVIEISGEYNETNVWTLAGQKAATANGGNIEVPAGLYIVNIDGRAVKVLVK